MCVCVCVCVNGFAKILQLRTRIEIHFIAHYNNHTQGLSRHSDTISIESAFAGGFLPTL